MAEHVGVQRGASYPFDHLPVSQLLSTSNAFGDRAFADRPGYALRQGSRCHALKIRSWLLPFEAASSRFATPWLRDLVARHPVTVTDFSWKLAG
jgi:hypothetical protein